MACKSYADVNDLHLQIQILLHLCLLEASVNICHIHLHGFMYMF
jgi:hypothetical protein